MPHDHAHAHDHAGHAHVPAADTADARRRVAIAAVLTAGFMLAEVAGGLISGSLALLADAAHMLTDAASLALAWVGFWLAAKPADDARSYGFARMKILAAFANGLALVALAVWITWEAAERLMAPQEVMGGLLLAVAVVGLVVNLACFAILHGGDREDLNLRGALWHVAGDLLGSVAAIAAACVILLTGWMPIDPILSVAVALLVGWAGFRIARQAGHILIEGAPPGLSPADIARRLAEDVPGVAGVSHVHAWAFTERRPMVTLEVDADAEACPETVRRAVKAHLSEVFDVSHSTVEVRSRPRAVADTAS